MGSDLACSQIFRILIFSLETTLLLSDPCYASKGGIRIEK